MLDKLSTEETTRKVTEPGTSTERETTTEENPEGETVYKNWIWKLFHWKHLHCVYERLSFCHTYQRFILVFLFTSFLYVLTCLQLVSLSIFHYLTLVLMISCVTECDYNYICLILYFLLTTGKKEESGESLGIDVESIDLCRIFWNLRPSFRVLCVCERFCFLQMLPRLLCQLSSSLFCSSFRCCVSSFDNNCWKNVER